jgi:hypothetical protein
VYSGESRESGGQTDRQRVVFAARSQARHFDPDRQTDRQTDTTRKGTIAIAQIEKVVFAARSQARHFDPDRPDRQTDRRIRTHRRFNFESSAGLIRFNFKSSAGLSGTTEQIRRSFVLCHERQLQGLERKAKVEGSQLRLYKAKEGSRKHEALHA